MDRLDDLNEGLHKLKASSPLIGVRTRCGGGAESFGEYVDRGPFTEEDVHHGTVKDETEIFNAFIEDLWNEFLGHFDSGLAKPRVPVPDEVDQVRKENREAEMRIEQARY